MNRVLKKFIHVIASDKVVSHLKTLNSVRGISERIEMYYLRKLKLSCYVLSGGIVLVLVSSLSNKGLIENGKIRRNDIGGGDKKITLYANTGESSEKVDLTISEKRYTDDEINKLANGLRKRIFSEILGDNESLDRVCTNLNFANHIAGYPFEITYRTDKPLILSGDGVINEEKLEEEVDVNKGINVGVIATISYYDYKEEIEFYVCVYKRKLSKEETLKRAINNKLMDEDKASISEEYYTLPSVIDSKRITFVEEKKNDYLLLIFVVVVVAISVFFLSDSDLQKEVEERKKELEYEYPTLVNKFALFLGAGMPVKNIWMKICSSYEKGRLQGEKKIWLYEEMLVARNQMLDGKSELEAYEEFAKRINMRKYRVFVNLLEQAITVGKSDILSSFKLECNDAFIERKNNAKKQFEEAGTKLLVPMFMMLLVVIVILMFPAFYSFKM